MRSVRIYVAETFPSPAKSILPPVKNTSLPAKNHPSPAKTYPLPAKNLSPPAKNHSPLVRNIRPHIKKHPLPVKIIRPHTQRHPLPQQVQFEREDLSIHTKYFIRYFRPDGKEELRLGSGTLLFSSCPPSLSPFLTIKKEASAMCVYFLLVILFHCFTSTNRVLSLSQSHIFCNQKEVVQILFIETTKGKKIIMNHGNLVNLFTLYMEFTAI